MEHGDSAEARLRTLTTYFREHPEAGRPERRATSTTPKAPLNLPVLSHIQDSVAEVIAFTEAANPEARKTRPATLEGVYGWCREHLSYADGTVPLVVRTLEIRHYLEHTILAGDATTAIRPIWCPACETPGLLWRSSIHRAVCINRHCARRNDGIHRTWTTEQLARREAIFETTLRECAT
ncbi:hypothetical protein [Streptomyces chilikensis]|uniref:Uncharacterized protein n=1 Tax=Streptomyces chilikensis TaxID=1194079 RepID=A0ABV3ERD5_9ACTN